MARAKDIYDRVREAQKLLGTGEVDEALEQTEPLRQEAVRILSKGAMLSSFDRSWATQAYAYASITLILGLAEAKMPAEFVPRIRELAAEAARRNRQGTDIWKAVAAAAEVLARAGDAEGACWAMRKAHQLNPKSDDLAKVSAGISSMYPKMYSQTPEEVPDDPPPLPEGRK